MFIFISLLIQIVIHHILSVLSLKFATLTSILSKQGRHHRMTFPLLNFDGGYFDGKKDDFLKFVDDTIKRMCVQELQVKKFSLKFENFLTVT